MSSKIRRPQDAPQRRLHGAGEEPEAHVKELAALGELMLGAAWADGVKVAVEVIAVAEQLKDFVAADHLPRHVQQRLEAFAPETFDPAAAVGALRLGDTQDRVAVLTLLARVTHSDRELHAAEDAYLRKVAGLLGLDPETIEINFR